MTTVEQFSAFVRSHAIAAGYDLSGPRSGGRKALAEDTGMSHASTCRMLAGQTIPDADRFERIANALGVHVGYLFELAGLATPGTLTGEIPAPAASLTTAQAARRLGIRGKRDLALFTAITEALRAAEEQS